MCGHSTFIIRVWCTKVHKREVILLATTATLLILTFIVGAPALNMIIEVKVMETKLSERSEVNKMKIDLIPENLTIGERAKIIVRDSGGKLVEGVKIYVAENHNPSTKGIYIGETNSNGELTHIFEKEGWYRIYAEKEGFSSQVASIYVGFKGFLSFSRELKRLYDDRRFEVIRITSNGRPVEKVEIYINGTFVGYTDSDGELSYMFKCGEIYEIVVKKEGYRGSLIILDLDPRGGTGTTIRPIEEISSSHNK